MPGLGNDGSADDSHVESQPPAVPYHSAGDFVSIPPEDEAASQNTVSAASLPTIDPKDELIQKLRDELAELKSRPHLPGNEGSETPDGLRRQYESKLKDVMEKAREHAKKLAQDRDEQRKLNEEKEAKLSQYKQLMSAANAQLEERDSTIRELEKAEAAQKQEVEKLNQQMKSMETHFTKPPPGPIEASLNVVDSSGLEWILVGDRWWARSLVSGQVTVKQALSVSQLRELESDMTKLKLAASQSSEELTEYKRKVEKVLREKSSSSSSSRQADPEAGVETARKILKLESEIAQHQSTIQAMKKQVTSLQSSEKNLVSQVSSAKAELSRLVDPVNKMESQIVELKSDKKVLSEKLAAARGTISELTLEQETARLATAVQQNLKVSPVVVQASETTPVPTSAVKEGISISVQTELLPAILRSDHTPQASTPMPEMIQPPSRPELVNPQHDAVAFPLRQQIKDLIIELEDEKHEHTMTITQLNVVKEELRKLEAQKKLGTDLTDPVKVEYMRNVARRFIASAPNSGSDEFEQLIPVILNFFGLEGDEAVRLMKERRKRLEQGGHLSFPKLW
jgi:hypothetical protein